MKQPSITTTLSAFFAHCAIAERGAVNISPWHPRRYGSSFATKLAARRAISPRMQPPSQEMTGIFPSANLFFPATSPMGQRDSVPTTSIEKLVFDLLMLISSFNIDLYFLKLLIVFSYFSGLICRISHLTFFLSWENGISIGTFLW
jgi:hypothetical protein